MMGLDEWWREGGGGEECAGLDGEWMVAWPGRKPFVVGVADRWGGWARGLEEVAPTGWVLVGGGRVEVEWEVLDCCLSKE